MSSRNVRQSSVRVVDDGDVLLQNKLIFLIKKNSLAQHNASRDALNGDFPDTRNS